MQSSLRAYQEIGVSHIMNLRRCSLWAGMGLGKTRTVLEALLRLDLLEEVFPALVLAPLRVARSTWPEEVLKWRLPIRVAAIVGTPEERLLALRSGAQVMTMNYENLPWLRAQLGKGFPFKTVVADESTRLKGFRLRQGTTRARALAKMVHKSGCRFVNLTGTPAANGLLGLWGQQWFIDEGQALGITFSAFQDRWFRAENKGGDPHAIRWIPFPHSQGEIEGRLRPTCLTIDPVDWFDLREPIHTTVEVELPSAAMKKYRDMEEEMFVELEGVGVEAMNSASKTVKCLQLASGSLYTDKTGSYIEVHAAKLDALDSVIEEASGAPVLVAYQFKSDLDRIMKRIPDARVLDKRPETLTDWNTGGIPVLLAHPASAGHGLNLQDGGNRIVFFGHWWNLEERQQIIERIGPVRQLQAGHDRPVWIYDIVAKGTIDGLVLKRHKTKQDVQTILLEAMKRGRCVKR